MLLEERQELKMDLQDQLQEVSLVQCVVVLRSTFLG